MHQMAVSIAFSLAVLCTLPAAAQEHRIVVAQGEVRVPSDADLERMEERGARPPREAAEVSGQRIGEKAEDRQMDERSRRVDQELLTGGAICRDCK